jgi:uncharacterized protein
MRDSIRYMDFFTLLLCFISYAAIGGLSGLISGLLGIGGGSITVPLLLIVFSLAGFPKSSVMYYAIGTSLANMSIITAFATYFHHKSQRVSWSVCLKILPSLLLGSLLGVCIAKHLSTSLLEYAFGVFVCIIGIYLIKPVAATPKIRALPHFFPLNILGLLIACLSNLLGIGGGIFMVPTLAFYGFDAKKAIGTSTAASAFISLIGSQEYLFFAKESAFIPHSVGYIYLPAFCLIVISSLSASFYGVKLVQRLPAKTLKKIFSTCLIATGLMMIFK